MEVTASKASRPLGGKEGQRYRGRWHELNEEEKCVLLDEVWDQFIQTMKEIPKELFKKVNAYSELKRLVRGDIEEWKCDMLLSAKERYKFHAILDKMGFKHESRGDGDMRRLFVTLPSDGYRFEYSTRQPTPPHVRIKQQEFQERQARKRAKREREEYEDVRFQVYCKFRSHGYSSPEEMLSSEPMYAEFLGMGEYIRDFEHDSDWSD